MKWSITGQIGLVTLVTFIFLVFLAKIFYANSLEQVEAAKWLIHTHEVLSTTEAALAKEKDFEIGYYDYQLTGRQGAYKLCREDLDQLQKEVNRVAALTTDNDSQQERIPWLNSLLFDWHSELKQSSSLVGSAPGSTAHAISTSNATGTQIREILKEIREEEYGLLNKRNDAFREDNSRDIQGISLFICITFFLLIISFISVSRYEHERKVTAKQARIQYDITRSLAQAESLEEVVQEFMAVICDGLGFDYALLHLDDTAMRLYAEEEEKPIRMTADWRNPKNKRIDFSSFINNIKISQVLNMVRERSYAERSLIWLHGNKLAALLSDQDKLTDMHSLVIVPMRFNNSVIGSFELFSSREFKRDSTIAQLLESLAQQLSQSIERRKLDQRLKEREEIFRQLTDNIQEVFWVSLPIKGKYLYISPAYERAWGFSRQNAYKDQNLFLEAILPEDRPQVEEILTREDLPVEGAIAEYRIIKPNGEERWIWSNTFAVKDKNGKTVRLCGIAHDVTERKEMEKRVSEFYSMVSHELRTPLTSIRAALGLLEGGLAGALSEKADQLVKIAKNESERLIRLINDILDIRKIAAGKLELKKEMVNTTEIVDLTIKSLEAMALDLQVRLVGETKTKQAIFADRDRIIQVLTNLVSNSIKFSPPGTEIRIILEGAREAVKFSVVDQGPGIPANKLHQLFRPFQQLDSSDTRAKGGTGLGLTISKAIVEEHGGKIGVDTTPGIGSTFWFELPLIGQQPIQVASELDTTSMPKVLMVEDDLQLAELLKLRLQQDGYNLIIAPDLARATELLHKDNINAIILDIQLPDGNGLDWLKRERDSLETKTIPTIVITGRERNMNTYSIPMLIAWLRKPFEESELLQALKTAVKQNDLQKAKVLLVEDDRVTRKLIMDQLQCLNLQFFEAADGATAINKAIEVSPDLIILDIGLPYKDGFTVVEVLRHEKVHNTPLLVYTSRDMTREEMQKLRLGLTKHLVKSRTSEAKFLAAVHELLSSVTAHEPN